MKKEVLDNENLLKIMPELDQLNDESLKITSDPTGVILSENTTVRFSFLTLKRCRLVAFYQMESMPSPSSHSNDLMMPLSIVDPLQYIYLLLIILDSH